MCLKNLCTSTYALISEDNRYMLTYTEKNLEVKCCLIIPLRRRRVLRTGRLSLSVLFAFSSPPPNFYWSQTDNICWGIRSQMFPYLHFLTKVTYCFNCIFLMSVGDSLGHRIIDHFYFFFHLTVLIP